MAIVQGLLAAGAVLTFAAPASAVGAAVVGVDVGHLFSQPAGASSATAIHTTSYEAVSAATTGNSLQLASLLWLLQGAIQGPMFWNDFRKGRNRSRLRRERGHQVRDALRRMGANSLVEHLNRTITVEPQLFAHRSGLEALPLLLKRAAQVADPVLADLYWELYQCTQSAEVQRQLRAIDKNLRSGGPPTSDARAAVLEKVQEMERQVQETIAEYLLDNLHPHAMVVAR